MKKHFFRSILIFLSFLILIFSLNYFIDPYGVFRENYERRKTPLNERYIKTKYIIKNPHKYDSYIFGSSRVGTLKGENLNNGKFYNMTFSGANPSQILETLIIFEREKIKIENIILGIDDFHLYINPQNEENILYKLSYDKLTKSNFSLFENYILINPFNKITYEHFLGNKIVDYDISNTGKWSLPLKEIEIEKNPLEHQNNKIFEIPQSSLSDKPRLKDSIREIEKIVEFCENKKIKLTVIFLPLHKKTYENNNFENLVSFKKELQKITSYWDFAELNKFTENNYYWYETSHYRPILGDLILKKIFDEQFTLEINLKDEENSFGKFKKKIEIK